jgi:1-acyl-sn-glycerol-3-phosphate acyltransferase
VGFPVLRFVSKRYFPVSWEGRELVPAGPVVVAPNHFSHLDPLMVALAVGRPIRYLALDELFGRSRLFDGLTLWLGAIPLPRGRAPLGALRVALAELAAGGTVGVYPEGMRVWTWGEEEPRKGAAWLARRAGVPLLPVAIEGSDQAMGRGTRRIGRRPIHITVCRPILPGDFQDAPDPVAAVMTEWKRRVGAAVAVRRPGHSPRRSLEGDEEG